MALVRFDSHLPDFESENLRRGDDDIFRRRCPIADRPHQINRLDGGRHWRGRTHFRGDDENEDFDG